MVSDFFPLPHVCDGCVEVNESPSERHDGLGVLWQEYNNTDLGCADIASENQHYPKGTTDTAGIAQCQSFCANHSECGGYVFVSGNPGTPTPGGPRCAIKGSRCCPGASRGGCFSGLKPGVCTRPVPPPGPPHPSPPPPPSPPIGPITHVHESGNTYTLVHFAQGVAKDEAGNAITCS